MKRREIVLVVKLKVDDSVEGRVTNAEAAAHIREAVSTWGGQYTPDFWQWPSHIKVTVRTPKP